MKKFFTLLSMLLTFVVGSFAEGKTIYLDADQWQPNDGHFAVWAWEGDEFDITKGTWIPLEYVEGELAIYKATLPQGCTHVNFARFIKTTPVGGYAWEQGEDVDNRPYHCTQDITLQDDVDTYRITMMGAMYRTAGIKAANIEAKGMFAPREWNWQEYTVTFKTNKSWEKVYAVVWSGSSESGNNYTNLTATTLDEKNIARVKAPGRLIEQSDGVYTFTFKAEAAPEYIRFGDGKGSKDNTFARTTDNLPFENGKLYELYDPKTIYLDADQWQPNDGHFAVWAWEGDEFDITKGTWIPMEYVEGELAIYKATLPQGCTHVNFARFIKATPVGEYAWEKNGDVDNRPYHCTQDITLQDDVDRYRITAMGVLYRNTGTRAANIEAAGLFSPREWNWQEFTVTFKTNKSWEKVYAVVWSGTSETGNNYTNLTATTLDEKTIARVKAPGRLIEQADGVYTFTFKAEAAPEYIRFGDGKGSKDATFARTTDNLAFENGKLYELYDPKTIYLDADQWQPNDGHFAVWAWEGDEFDITKGTWIPLEYVEGELAIYKATLPQGCTHVNFARFIKATPVGEYAWEKNGDVDNRPYQCTQDITLQDDVDTYRITAMGVMYRTAGVKAANFEAKGMFTPREWNWQEFTVTFKTNKSWEKVYAVVWSGASETGNNYTNLTATTLDEKTIARVKAPGRLIEQSDGVYTFTFKAEAAPEYIRFGDGKGSKDATFARTTDNLAFENGKLYELYDPKTIYLDADQWQPNDGHFAVWAWEGDEFDITKGTWIPLEYVEGELAIYKATLPQGCTHVNFARFIKATPVGEYAWEKNGDVDNRPYQCTQDITLQDDVDTYRITAMGVMYRTAGVKAANFEAKGMFTPREWNWQEFTVTFKTNKSWEKVYAVVWSGASETGNNYTNLTATTLDEKNIARVKAPGRLIEQADGVYTFTFKAEAAPEYIRFGDGKGSKDATFSRTTDNLAFENGKLYELYDPEYYLVGSMNDWSINEQYKLEANPGAEGEYMITLSLEAGAELKVRGIDGTWYPDNAPNYKVEQAGNYTVYFRPDGSGGDDWHYHVIYVTGTSGILSVKAALEKGAVIYTLQGKRVTEVRKGNIYIMNGKKILVK